MHFKEGVSFDAAICLVHVEVLSLAMSKIVPVQVDGFMAVWLGFAAKLAMETGVCYWLGLLGLQVVSGLALPAPAPADSPGSGRGH